FNCKHSNNGYLLHRRRQMMKIPGGRRGQRPSLVLIIQGSETPPCRITAEQLHGAGLQHQSKDQETEHPYRHPWRRIGIRRTNTPGRKQNRRDACLQKQSVPLKREECLAGGINGEVKDVQTDGGSKWQEAE